MTLLRSICLLLLYIRFIFFPISSEAAHARKRSFVVTPSSSSTSNLYDRSITTFDDQGRLRQVEYAMEAVATKGSTVACVTVDLRSILFQNEAILRAFLPPTDNHVQGMTHHTIDPNTEDSRLWKQILIQGQIVLLVVLHDTDRETELELELDSESNPSAFQWNIQEDKVHRIDTNALLVTTGLVGDGLALARTLRRMALNQRLSFGEESRTFDDLTSILLLNATMTTPSSSMAMGGPVSLEILAQECASLQHELTRTNGARPLAVSAILIGLDPFSSSYTVPTMGNIVMDVSDASEPLSYPTLGSLRIFQSESGGILEEYQFCSAGIGAYEVQQKISLLLPELEKNVSDHLRHRITCSPSNTRIPLREIVQECASQIVQSLCTKVGNIIMKSHGDLPPKNHESNGTKTKRIDLYLMEVHSKGRDNLLISCAKDVSEIELNDVSTLLAQKCWLF